MFRFEAIEFLYLLVLIPVLLIILWYAMNWKKNILDKVGDRHIMDRLMSDWSAKKEWLKGSLLLTAILLLFVSASNPQWGSRKEKVKTKSSDVVIALDISQSMLAEDITPSRMERAKRFCNELIKKLKGDRIGLVFFAGSAYLQMPLSHDYGSAAMSIKSASPSQAGTQGTVIADALRSGNSVFEEEGANHKALIIISDGENHEEEAIQVAREISEEGTAVFTLGIGTEEGAYVPFIQNGKKTYKQDKNGNPVSSALNVNLLQEIADQGNGKFYMIDQAMTALNKLDSDIEKLEKKEVEQTSFSDYNSYFQLFLFPAILLLIINFLLSSRKTNSNWKQNLGL